MPTALTCEFPRPARALRRPARPAGGYRDAPGYPSLTRAFRRSAGFPAHWAF